MPVTCEESITTLLSDTTQRKWYRLCERLPKLTERGLPGCCL